MKRERLFKEDSLLFSSIRKFYNDSRINYEIAAAVKNLITYSHAYFDPFQLNRKELQAYIHITQRTIAPDID